MFGGTESTHRSTGGLAPTAEVEALTSTCSSVAELVVETRVPSPCSWLSGMVAAGNLATFGCPVGQPSAGVAATVSTGPATAVKVPPIVPAIRVALPGMSEHATTVHCAPGVTGS